MKSKFTSLFGLLIISTQFICASPMIDLTIRNIKSSNGIIRIAVFTDENGFKNEKVLFAVECPKNNVKDGQVKLQIPIQPGKFGISVLDDENNSGKMEYKFLGIPKKGFGFSNFYLNKLKKPSFDDFSFTIGKDEKKNIIVKMKYM